MNTVVIDGVTYTKAATLAKKFRYTSDYIGQLCRAGKVDAQLVGRSWYVSEASLERVSKKRIKAIRQDEILLNKNIHIDAGTDLNNTPQVRAPLAKNTSKAISNFYRDAVPLHSITSYSTTYESDSVDLIPTLKPPVPKILPQIPVIDKRPELSNNVSDSELPETELTIKTIGSSQNKLSFEPIPSISLKGSVPVKRVENPTATNINLSSSLLPAKRNNPLSQPSKPKPLPPPPLKTLPITYTPDSVVRDSVTSYKLLTASLVLLSVVVLVVPLLLNLEVTYIGTDTSIRFSFSQTALVNFFTIGN